MSFQLPPVEPISPERAEREAKCEQARREYGSSESLALTMLLLFVGTIVAGLLRHVMGW